MKIAVLISISAPTPYKKYYITIINYLTQQGHNISHNIKESDLLIAECSSPSINIGYEISHALQEEKEIIILKSKESGISFKISDPLFNDKNICIYEYDNSNLLSVLKEALAYNAPKNTKNSTFSFLLKWSPG